MVVYQPSGSEVHCVCVYRSEQRCGAATRFCTRRPRRHGKPHRAIMFSSKREASCLPLRMCGIEGGINDSPSTVREDRPTQLRRMALFSPFPASGSPCSKLSLQASEHVCEQADGQQRRKAQGHLIGQGGIRKQPACEAFWQRGQESRCQKYHDGGSKRASRLS